MSSGFSWCVGDGGDPSELLTRYLAENGLPVRELGRTYRCFDPVGAGEVCGAALYVSAVAASIMAGGPPGPRSPISDIPDVVAQIFVH